jgi:hypothetical protein
MSVITAEMTGASVSAGIEDGKMSICLALPDDQGFVAADLRPGDGVELAEQLLRLAEQATG